MSYPDPRYLGDKGEISAVLRPANAEPDLTTNSRAYHYLATTASTDGEFGLYRVDMAPKGGGPGTHFHKTISESFSSCPARFDSSMVRAGSTRPLGTFSTSPLVDCMHSATSPTIRRRCCCCSRRGPRANATSKG